MPRRTNKESLVFCRNRVRESQEKLRGHEETLAKLTHPTAIRGFLKVIEAAKRTLALDLKHLDRYTALVDEAAADESTD